MRVRASLTEEDLIMQRSHSHGGIMEGGDSIQDQIIIAPEIMSMILDQLDLRSLKRVRLVCKSWLREAGIHMEKKGLVSFYFSCSSEKIEEFGETLQKKIPELPQPFRSIGFGLHWSIHPRDYPLLVGQLSSLCPPLEITSINTFGVPLNLAIPLIIKFSSSLEFLCLSDEDRDESYSLPMDRAQVFPQLRHLIVVPGHSDAHSHIVSSHFLSTVAWIGKSCPSLEWYKSWNYTNGPNCTELLLKVDVKNVKTLLLNHDNFSNAVLKHFISIPFSRLEHLKMGLKTRRGDSELNKNVVIATVTKCVATLRNLDLSFIRFAQDLARFPVCPCVKELTLSDLKDLNNSISVSFPAVQVLNIELATVDVSQDSWKDLAPFQGLKTLTAKNLSVDHDFYYNDEYSTENTIKFLEKFPALESLGVTSAFVIHCCRLRATGDPRFSKLLEGVKHLKFLYWNRFLVDKEPDFAPLAVLKGIEGITLDGSFLQDIRDVLFLPYKDMLSLKVIRFYWKTKKETDWPMDVLLDMVKRVEKVVVSNCCLIRCSADALNKILAEDLNLFFDSAPNVECGYGAGTSGGRCAK